MSNDPVHALVQKAVAAINESEPWGLTATQVFHDGLDRLSGIELDALRETGWDALRHDDAFLPVDARMARFDVSQRTRELVAGGRDDALSEVPESDTPALALTGFVALVREAVEERRTQHV